MESSRTQVGARDFWVLGVLCFLALAVCRTAGLGVAVLTLIASYVLELLTIAGLATMLKNREARHLGRPESPARWPR